jgi:hypothetical protein
VRNQALSEAASVARCYDLGTPEGHAIADLIGVIKSASTQNAITEVASNATQSTGDAEGEKA